MSNVKLFADRHSNDECQNYIFLRPKALIETNILNRKKKLVSPTHNKRDDMLMSVR